MNGDMRDLDRDVVALKVANAELAVEVKGLSKQVASLETAVKDLNDTMNRGKGALWGIMGIAGALGAVVSTVAKKLLGLAG